MNQWREIFPDDICDDVVPDECPGSGEIGLPNSFQVVNHAEQRVAEFFVRVDVSADVYVEVPDDDAENYEQNDHMDETGVLIFCLHIFYHKTNKDRINSGFPPSRE